MASEPARVREVGKRISYAWTPTILSVTTLLLLFDDYLKKSSLHLDYSGLIEYTKSCIQNTVRSSENQEHCPRINPIAHTWAKKLAITCFKRTPVIEH